MGTMRRLNGMLTRWLFLGTGLTLVAPLVCNSSVADDGGAFPTNAVAGDSTPAPGPRDAAYMQESWPKARLLVWARPGRKGTGQPDDWLEDGKPATEPPDENTDLLVPGVEAEDGRPPRRWDLAERITCRHLTIAAGANAFIHTLHCAGNIWIEGRCMLISCNLVGSKHSFLRNDGPQARFTVYYTQSKPESSVELIGTFETQDEVRVFDGDLILAPDCRFEPGRNSTPIIDRRGRLTLLDGAYFGKWLNDMHSLDMVLGGTLQGGTLQRPLARDCTLALSFQNWSQVELGQSGEFAGDDRKSNLYRGLLARKAGMLVQEGGSIRTYREAGSEASLTITWHGLTLGQWRGKNSGYLDLTETLAELSEQYGRTIPPKITVYFDTNTTVDGLKLDHVHAGGILYRDQATRDRWQNITYGENNGGRPDQLFKHLPQGLTSRKPTY